MPEPTPVPVLEVFCQVLESLAFMFADPADRQDLPAAGEPLLEASIGFRGPWSGSLTLLAPQSLAGELAANVLGVDADDESAAEQGRDALGELMNVTLGRLLTAVAGEAPVFDLTPPTVTDAADERWPQFVASESAVAVLVDGRPVLLRFNAQTAETLDPVALSRSEP